MAKKTENTEYLELRRDLKEKRSKPLYAFYGSERFMLQWALKELRKRIQPGSEEFNDRRFDGKTVTIDELSDALEMFPAFSDFMLIEVTDFDFSKLGEDDVLRLKSLLADVPEYMCVVFIFDENGMKLDGRRKANAELKKLFTQVLFTRQEDAELRNWIKRHFAADGKSISDADADYLAYITGGLMTAMAGEIDKVTAYSLGERITRSDIDAVVIPTLEAQTYELTDALLKENYDTAASKLATLISMNEPAHRICYGIALTLRQLFCAKALISEGKGAGELCELFEKLKDFQARNIISAAKRISPDRARRLCDIAADAAFKLNSASYGDNEILKELIIELAGA